MLCRNARADVISLMTWEASRSVNVLLFLMWSRSAPPSAFSKTRIKSSEVSKKLRICVHDHIDSRKKKGKKRKTMIDSRWTAKEDTVKRMA